jgi:hypothetical protein
MSNTITNKENADLLMKMVKKNYVRYHSINKPTLINIEQKQYLNFIYINNLIKKQFYNPDILYFLLDLFTGILDDNFRNVKEWFNEFNVNTKDKASQTFELSSQNAKMGAFLLKAPSNENSNGLIVELFTGLFGWNRLRNEIPTFACIYGGFSCSKPAVLYGNLLKSWCTTDKDKVQYIIYEKIPGDSIFLKMGKQITPNPIFKSKPLSKRGHKVSSTNIQKNVLISEFKHKLYSSDSSIKYKDLDSYTIDELLLDILTISLSLDVARKSFKGQHGNLTLQNIIKRPLIKQMWVKFPVENPCWVKLNEIPTIVNYSLSTIQIKDERYGSLSSYGNIFNPIENYDEIYDIFFLLCQYMFTIKYFGAAIMFTNHMDVLINLLKYFGFKFTFDTIFTESFDNLIKLFLLRDRSKNSKESISGFVNYLIQHYPILKDKYTLEEPTTDILMCHDNCDSIDKIVLNTIEPVKIATYDDLRIIILNNKDNPELIEKLNRKYNYLIQGEMERLFTTLKNIQQQLKRYDEFFDKSLILSNVFITVRRRIFMIYPYFEEVERNLSTNNSLEILKNNIYDLLSIGANLQIIDNDLYKFKSLINTLKTNISILKRIEEIYDQYLSLNIEYKKYKFILENLQRELQQKSKIIIDEVKFHSLSTFILQNNIFHDLYYEYLF